MFNQTKRRVTPARPGPHMRSQDIPWGARARVLTLWAIAVALCIVILVARLPFSGQVALRVGDVAPRDVPAPRQVTYVSEILTQQRREMAANAVPPIYDLPQARIGRQQLTLANDILRFIGVVRSDSYADLPTKVTHLRAIPGLDLTAEVLTRTVTLPTPAWERVAGEIQLVLERAMRDEIRENTLADERRKVPARVRLDFSDEDAAIVTAVVQSLLVPNSFYNAERTEQRRQQARDRIEPVIISLERNETVLRAGDIVSEQDIESLEALGMRQSTWSWEDVREVAGFMLLLGLVFLYYLWCHEPQMWVEKTQSVFLALIVVVFMFGAKAMIPGHALLSYFFPYAALTMLVALVCSPRIALAMTGPSLLVVGWLTGGNVELIAYALAGLLVGMLKLRRGEHLASFAWAFAYIAAANLLVVAVFRLAAPQLDWRGFAELGAASLLNSLIAVVAVLVGIYLVGAIFGVVTPLHLIELSRPTHPLLRQLLLKAPGTYHHTLIVANMTERAAERIGADPLLSRVGAYYHDVGKTIRPYFFIENRSDSLDPHARLDAYTSAQIILSHVKDGIDLARKYRLPQRVIDFIPEHHGTLLVSYFYHQAAQQTGSSDGIDKGQFRYPGPRPQSAETAITMLADSAEATVRSRRPTSLEELEQIVAESIQNRVVSGQLDECPLTLVDLHEVRRAFVDVLRGLQHPRIDYPPEIGSAAPLVRPAPAVQPGPIAQPPKEKRNAFPTPPGNDSGASRAV